MLAEGESSPHRQKDTEFRKARRLLVATALIFFAASSIAQATTFHCAGGDVPCLIAAINSANATAAADTIILDAGTYNLTAVNNVGTSGDANGLPVITSPITIQGAGATATVLQQDPALEKFRIFQIDPAGTLRVVSLAVQNGTSGSQAGGGGFLNFGALAIIDSVVSHNRTEIQAGGGISSTGTLTLVGSRVEGNFGEGGSAGGINNAGGTMTVSETTISGNEADFGGGIVNSGIALITNSTIAGNAGDHSGGGIDNGGTLTISNSTIASNDAFDQGGGINNGGSVHLDNCTITDNTADGPGVGINNAGIVELQNTILARNVPSPLGIDCTGPITSLGHNIIGDPTGCTITLQSSDHTGDPGLGTFTGVYIPLLASSVAIDAADPTACSSMDQIGRLRIDGNGDGIVVCDIGAVEFGPAEQVVNGLVTLNSLTTSTNTTPVLYGPAGTFTITAHFTNTSSTPIKMPVFIARQLSNGDLLLDADRPPGTVGARLTPNVGDGVLSPKESLTATFTIALRTRVPFTFLVDLLGVPGP